MTNADRQASQPGALWAALIGALAGFLLGAILQGGNRCTTITVIPVGGDLVMGRTSAAPDSSPHDETD